MAECFTLNFESAHVARGYVFGRESGLPNHYLIYNVQSDDRQGRVQRLKMKRLFIVA